MKSILIPIAVLLTLTLTGCGTLGGAMQGAGEDLQKYGEWVRNR